MVSDGTLCMYCQTEITEGTPDIIEVYSSEPGTPFNGYAHTTCLTTKK